MVQRLKSNSTCEMTRAGWNLGGTRRDIANLKARSQGKKKQMKTWSSCNQYRLEEDQMDKNLEKQQLRDKCQRQGG